MIDLEKPFSKLKKFANEREILDYQGKTRSAFLMIFDNLNFFLEGLLGFGFIRGLEIGIREKEFVVELHTPVVIIGQFFRENGKGDFKIKSLDYIELNIKALKRALKKDMFLNYIGLTIFAFIAAYFFKRSYKTMYTRIRNFLKNPF